MDNFRARWRWGGGRDPPHSPRERSPGPGEVLAVDVDTVVCAGVLGENGDYPILEGSVDGGWGMCSEAPKEKVAGSRRRHEQLEGREGLPRGRYSASSAPRRMPRCKGGGHWGRAVSLNLAGAMMP